MNTCGAIDQCLTEASLVSLVHVFCPLFAALMQNQMSRLAEDLEWTEKFLYDGSVHSYSVMYAWGLTQFILRAIPSRLKLAILHHRFLPQTMVGVVAAAVDTRWRYFGRSTLHKERKLSKTKASFHESGKSTMGIYMPPDIRERIKNRRASLSIVDEGDSDAEIESPKRFATGAWTEWCFLKWDTDIIQGGCKYVGTCTTSDTRTRVASIQWPCKQCNPT